MPLLALPVADRLRSARHVLVAGAGGGFDVYAGLPLALALRAAGVRVSLASFALSELGMLRPEAWLRTGLAAVGPDAIGNDRYFPERALARWLQTQGHDPVVYAFERTGDRGVPRGDRGTPAPPDPALIHRLERARYRRRGE